MLVKGAPGDLHDLVSHQRALPATALTDAIQYTQTRWDSFVTVYLYNENPHTWKDRLYIEKGAKVSHEEGFQRPNL